MLDLPDYINQDFEVPDRYSMIPLCSKGILSKVIIKNEINSADHWAKCILSVSSEKDEEAFSSLFTHFAPRIKSFLMKSGTGAVASDIIIIQEETTLLAQAVKDLPSKQRSIVERAFYADLSHQEIADETGLPLGTIKSRIRLALQRLRHNMK